jgi:hypothetical protein
MDFGGGGGGASTGGGGGGGVSPSKKHLSALAKPKNGVSLPRGEDGRVDAKAVVTAGGRVGYYFPRTRLAAAKAAAAKIFPAVSFGMVF